MKPTRCPEAICSVHDVAVVAPWRVHAALLIGSASTGTAPKLGVAPVCKAVKTVVQSAAVPVTLMSQPASPRLAAMRHALASKHSAQFVPPGTGSLRVG